MGTYLPDYMTPGEIAAMTGISESKILKDIKGNQTPPTLFAWKSQGWYWIPELLAKRYMATGIGLPRHLPDNPNGRSLPGYYTPKELSQRLGITHVAVLQKIRGRPERNKPASLFAYPANGRFWVPEAAAESIIQHYEMRRS